MSISNDNKKCNRYETEKKDYFWHKSICMFINN